MNIYLLRDHRPTFSVVQACKVEFRGVFQAHSWRDFFFFHFFFPPLPTYPRQSSRRQDNCRDRPIHGQLEGLTCHIYARQRSALAFTGVREKTRTRATESPCQRGSCIQHSCVQPAPTINHLSWCSSQRPRSHAVRHRRRVERGAPKQGRTRLA